MPDERSDPRTLAEQIARAAGKSVAGLGLRFDRVVARVLSDLHPIAAGIAPANTTILLTLTAPIRTPARTTRALGQELAALLRAPAARADRRALVCGNAVRLRLVRHGSARTPALIGFVHNPDSAASELLDLAEAWLRAPRR